MAGTELATAYLTLIPSLRGATKQIESELGGMDTSSAAKKIGSGLGKGIGDNLDLKAAGSKLEDFGGKISDVGDSLTSHFTVPLAAAAVGAGAFAIKTASAAETSEMAFTTMLGSAEAARDMLETLANFAAKTPFELSGLTTATQQLLAYGFTAEDIIPMLTAVGDATAALGTGQVGIEAVTRALGQMQTKGKVSAEEMLQLTEQGIPAWQYLADAIGTDTAGAMEKVSDGAVKASDGIKAITDGMNRDFGGMMEAQSKTVEGLMSNLSDAIEQPLMKLRDSDAYDKFAESLSKIVDSAEPFVESLLPHLEKGLDKVSGLLDIASDAMDAFSGMSEQGQSQIIGLVTNVALLGPELKALGPVIKTVGSVMKGATSATSLLTGGLVGLGVAVAGIAINSLVSDFLEARENEKLLADATMDFDDILAQAGETADTSGKAIADSMTQAAEQSKQALQDLADLNSEAVDTLSELNSQSSMLDTYVDTINELAGQSDLTASQQERLKQAVEGYNSITGDSVEVTNAAAGELSKSTDEINRNADAWERNARVQAYQNLASQYLQEQLEAEQNLADAREKLAAAQERYQQALESGDQFDQLAAAAEVEQYTDSVEKFGTAANEAADKYEAFSASAAIAASNLSDDMKSALSDLPESMQMAGLDIATSLSSGIESGTVSADAAMQFLNDSVAGTVASLPPTMRDKGMQAAQSLADAVASGQISVEQAAMVLTAAVNGDVSALPDELAPYGEQAASALGSAMSLNSALAGSGAGDLSAAASAALKSMPSNFSGMGISSSQSLSDSLSAGTSSAASSAGSLADAASSGVSTLPSALGNTGTSASSQFATGVGSGEGATRSAANKLSSAASKMGDGDSWTWGNHLGSNFASGLRAASSFVSSAASTIASVAANILHFSTPDDGPWSGSEKGGFTSGLHLGENFAAGMMAAVPGVRSASLSLAAASAYGFGSARSTYSPAYGASSSYAHEVAGEILAALPSIIRDNSPSAISLDSRTFGQLVRRYQTV